MSKTPGRLRGAVYLCLALLLLSLIFHVFGPGLAKRLANSFHKPSNTGLVETEESEGLTAAVEDIVTFFRNLFEWDNAAWWGRLFQAVAIGSFALALIIAAVVTHRLIGASPPPPLPPPVEKPRSEEPWL